MYAGSPIRERDELLCLTDMWKASGSDPSRRPSAWLRSAEAENFIGFLAETLNVRNSHTDLVTAEKGGTDSATWAHWQIGMAYAKYLSPEFHAWCNEVVRNHMEGRLKAAGGLPQGWELFARALKEAIAPLAVRHDGHDRAIERVEHRVDSIASDVANIRARLEHSRRRLTESTKREHVEAVRALGGRCPCCGTAVVVDHDGTKARFAEFDHFYQNSQPSPDHTWLICQPCHTKLTTARVPRDRREAAFRAYQDKRRELPGRQVVLF